jgi:putative heme-binding domain-containing protein
VNLQDKSDLELVQYQLNENDWYVRHARRILQERNVGQEAFDILSKAMSNDKDDKRRLRALWAYNAILGDTTEINLRGKNWLDIALRDKSPYVRAWAIQLSMQKGKPEHSHTLEDFERLAKTDDAAVVRLYLASALQKIAPKDGWQIAEHLLSHSEDADDQNLPLMYWYAIEPLAEVDPVRALALALNGKIPQLHGFMIRRIGAGENATNLLIDALAKNDDGGKQLTFLTAIREALKGRRQVKMPDAWPKLLAKFQGLSVNDARRQQAVCLAVTFGNPGPALDMVKGRGHTANQTAAISALLDAGHPKLTPELHWLLDSELKGTTARRSALRGLAAYEDPATPNEVLRRFPDYTPEEKIDALNTMAARPSYAKALLNAIAKKQIPASAVSADIVRQLRNLKDAEVSKRINEVWGTVRESAEERKKLMASYKKMLTTPPETPPDLKQGRAIFNKTCAQCHTLFGVGGKVGPDLTGSNRANLDYLLENIIDPSAVIPKEYAASVIEMKDGRTLTGIIKCDTKIALTVMTVNEVLTLPRKEVDTLTVSKVSMMPDDILTPMKEAEVRALIAYLRSPVQVEAGGMK